MPGRAWVARLKAEVQVLLHNFLIPAVTVLLPARAGLLWLKFWAKHLANPSQGASADWAIARQYVMDSVGDSANFMHRAKTYALLDWADVYLASLRPRAVWLRKNIEMRGDLPPTTPAMAITMHYGAGLWSLPLLSQYWPVGWVYATMVYPGQTIQTKLSDQRLRAIRTMRGVALLNTPGAYQKMQDYTASGGGVVGLVDAPDTGHRTVSPIQLFGHELHLANGLVRFAVAEKMPIYLYTVSLCPKGEKRIFRGKVLTHPSSQYVRETDNKLKQKAVCDNNEVNAVMQEIGQWMETEILQDPAAWHLWGFSQNFSMKKTAAVSQS